MVTQLGPAKITVELDTQKVQAQLDSIRNQVARMGGGGVGGGAGGGTGGGTVGEGGEGEAVEGGGINPSQRLRFRTKQFLNPAAERARRKTSLRGGSEILSRRMRKERRGFTAATAAARGGAMGMGMGAARGAMGAGGTVGMAVGGMALAAGAAYSGAVAIEQMGPMIGEAIKEATKDTAFSKAGEYIDNKLEDLSQKITEEVTSRIAAIVPSVKKTEQLERAKFLLGENDMPWSEIKGDYDVIYDAIRAQKMGERHQETVMNEVTGGMMMKMLKGARR